ncbi:MULTISPECIES: helix-turn-helix domain-containing protein [Bartonella]|uniref:Transcriptional regulator with XRE-family HTH domain n=1 Tax=Bartonella chomelii TaxID=236402 RepID=A0ABR6E5M6_9HYPH|nr:MULTISPECIES: helix-turn-helix transcriptional regulator [Bartonella]MBA9083553.1 transcriptional regulator with XRE-family HTH domain [Bartonella chomelii]
MKKIAAKQLRKKLNLTLEEMAAHLGVNKSTVWRWEKYGIPSRGAAAYLLMAMWESIQETSPTSTFAESSILNEHQQDNTPYQTEERL